MLLQRLHRAERFNQWAGYLYLPYQFLQITGYRLVGKRCDYQWRSYRPEPIGPITPIRHFIASVFPAAVCCAILAWQVVLSLYFFRQYFSPQTPWPVFFVLLQPVPFSLYGYLMIFDFLRLRRLLSAGANKDHD